MYSCGSPSNVEPGTSSSSVRTVKDGSEPLVIPTFPLQGLTSIAELAFVCLTHDGGLKFRDVISALRYSKMFMVRIILMRSQRVSVRMVDGRGY